MPDLKVQLPQTPDLEWKDTQFKFDGTWMPDTDGALIGPNNYQTLRNLRYKDSGLEGVNGYTVINTTALDDGATTTYSIRSGQQLRTDKTQSTYVLVNAVNPDDDQGYVYVNRTAIGTAGDFDSTSKFDISGNAYHTDATTGLLGRFSEAPQGNVAFCNGEESMIFGGDEQRVAACFSATIDLDPELILGTDATLAAAHNWTNTDINAYNDSNDITVTASAVGQYCSLPQANAITSIGSRYQFSVDVANLVGSWTIKDVTGADTYGIIDTEGLQITLSFRATTTGGVRIVSNETTSSADFDNFSLKPVSHSEEVDVTERVNNLLFTDSVRDLFTVDSTDRGLIIMCTTRPIQAFKLYVAAANLNTTASSLQCGVWDGTGYTDDIINVDGTIAGGASLGQTGVVTLNSHTDATAELHHESNLFLYTYLIQLSAGDADIYHITVDYAFQSIKDVWDGVYRQPIQFQRYDGTSYFDYTLQVNESSSLDAPIGAEVGQLATTDKLYIMFEDETAGIRFTMLGDLVNTTAVTGFSVKYWDGSAFAAVSNPVDSTGTGDDGSGALFGSTGLISWTPTAPPLAREMFGSFGFVYELSFTGAGPLDGAAFEDVLIDICTGIPAPKEVLPFAWPALYGTRLMLGGYAKGDQGNRLDYSVANAPDAWNGFDSSDDGRQSLYFGGVEPIVAARQLYNRFGASIFSMLLVLKRGEVYLLIGDTPEDFTIYPVAQTIGCIAPKTLATAEIGLDLGQGLTRNVAIWLSHSGPVMFDGAVLSEINGIKSYFDAADDKFVNFTYVKNAVGWVDSNRKEYNLLMPSGTSATKNNVWLVYDLRRKKWFEKSCGSSSLPQTGFEARDEDTGEHIMYGGIDLGQMVYLENGTTWGDATNAGISQRVKVGDFFPSGNIWDETLLRKFKIFVKRIQGSSVVNSLHIAYYNDTEGKSGTGVIWQDVELSSGVFVDWEDTTGILTWDTGVSVTSDITIGLQRVVKLNHDLNRRGWAHAFEFSLTTTDATKAFQPMMWGVQYRVERKDNTV